ncbi:MAG: hypothetical protein A2073_02805 [Deltaproteobacteria bacterium GWC2_42_11]|nr:MAG: hypothetical protein A2073_02805 [Deltaproteobacteria bacterium GWC2_42_11]HBO83799.1 hypothetical protein [Deltaproteobacteria bacterium]
MFYKAIVECGHMGAGNSFERVWFIKGDNPLSVLKRARMFPRVKKKNSLMSIKLLQRISKEEYICGTNQIRYAAVQ